jgi:hypothetical protein
MKGRLCSMEWHMILTDVLERMCKVNDAVYLKLLSQHLTGKFWGKLQSSQLSCLESNSGSPNYEAGALTTKPKYN